MQKKYTWYKIAEDKNELQFGINNMMHITVESKTICLAKGSSNLYACSHKCPHAGGIIADGFIDAMDNVVCPLHRYKFNLQSGRNISGEGYYLKIYPIQQTEHGIFVGIEEKSMFSW